MTDLTITDEIQYVKANFITSRCLVPLRFIERDGKRILQHPYVCDETQEVEWRDVPLVPEQGA